MFSLTRFPENSSFLSETWLFHLYTMKEAWLGMFATKLAIEGNLHLILRKQNSLTQKEAAREKKELKLKDSVFVKCPRKWGWGQRM